MEEKKDQDSWNPQQYQKFEEERNLPFYDLLKLVVPHKNMNVVDLGCGTGKLTKVLHETVRAEHTLGIDSSQAMLNESKQYQQPHLQFARMDIHNFDTSDKYDLIFSNAALQWVPDHFSLFAHLADQLTSEGQFAFQVPANFDYPTHVIASELALEEPFRTELKHQTRYHHILTLEEYAKLLYQLGFKKQLVDMRVYPHILESTESVIEWVKGSLLTYYQSRLSSGTYELFLQLYCKNIYAFFGTHKPFFLPFKRILLWAQK